jgi:hypothetical protein
MEVPTVEQHSNVRTATDAAGVGPRPGNDAGRSTRRTSPTDPNQNGVALARVAVFDLKGDGHINPRSVFEGGDATLLVPDHPLYLSTDARVVPVAATSGAAGTTPSDRNTGGPLDTATGGVRAHQAIAAYRHVAASTTPAAANNVDAVGRRA